MISYVLKILNAPLKHHKTFLYEEPYAAFLQVHYLAKTIGFNRRLNHIKMARPKVQKLSLV